MLEKFKVQVCPIVKGPSNTLILLLSNANGHITLNTPVLVRSLKLSNVESSQYLAGINYSLFSGKKFLFYMNKSIFILVFC